MIGIGSAMHKTPQSAQPDDKYITFTHYCFIYELELMVLSHQNL